MTSKTRTAQTAYGNVEYETVDCSSCGQETRKEDATRFIMGRVNEHHSYHSFENVQIFDGHTVRKGPESFGEDR